MQPTKRARGKPHSHFPGESRDPGTTEHWLATRRTSSRHGLRGTERAVFSRAPGHRAGRRPAALRSVLWQRHHYGSWAPAFAGETNRVGARTLCRRNTRCAEVRAVAAAPPRLLGPRFRGGDEGGMNPSIVLAESPLR